MLTAESVHFRYPGSRERLALAGITLSIRPGEWVALMGANGSGKSTLLKVLAGFLEPTEGRVRVDGSDLASLDSRADIAARIGIVFQDPGTQLFSATVERELVFGMEQLGVPRDRMRARVEEMLERFNLGALRRRAPQSLSGGEKQRVAVAAVLGMRPRILLLDEPTALLDARSRVVLLEMLAGLRREECVGVLQVTASPDEALQADRVVVLAEGRQVADQPPRGLFSSGDAVGGWGLRTPPAVALARSLRGRGIRIPGPPMTVDEFVLGWEDAVGRPGTRGSMDP